MAYYACMMGYCHEEATVFAKFSDYGLRAYCERCAPSFKYRDDRRISKDEFEEALVAELMED